MCILPCQQKQAVKLYTMNTHMQNWFIITNNLRLEHALSEEPAGTPLQARPHTVHPSAVRKVTRQAAACTCSVPHAYFSGPAQSMENFKLNVLVPMHH